MTRKVIDASEIDDENIAISAQNAPDPKEEAAEYAIMRALSEVGNDDEGGYVMIHRADSGRGVKEESYLTKMDISDFTSLGLDGIRQEYGPGKYRIRIYDGNTNLRTNRHIRLEPLPGTLPKNSGQSDVSQTAVILEAMQQMNQNFLAGLQAITQQIVSTQQSAPQKSTRDLLEEMVMMKQIIGGNESNNGAAQMELLLKGLEIGRTIDGGEPSGAGVFMELVKQAMPAIMQNAAQNNRPQLPPRKSSQVPAPVAPPIQAVPPINPGPERSINPAPEISTEENDMSLMFKAQLMIFVQAARANKDVGPYAEIVLDMADDDTLSEFVDDAQIVDKLGQINPDVLIYRVWFEKLIAEIRSMTQEENENSDDVLTHNPYSDTNSAG